MKTNFGMVLLLIAAIFSAPLQAQYSASSSNLKQLLDNTRYEKAKTDSKPYDGKTIDKMGTRVCINLDGVATKAMVTGGGGPVWGPNKDSYHLSIMEGPKASQVMDLKPNVISALGDCPEEYIPVQFIKLPSNIDIRQMELDIIKEVNIVRASPGAYADMLAKLKFEDFGQKASPYRQVVLGATDVMHSCEVDDRACQEEFMKKLKVAIDYLRNVKSPLTILAENSALAKGSEMLAADKGEINGAAHTDSKGRGAGERARVAGYNGWRGECLNGGHNTAAGFVISFLSSPGHRDILMKTNINEIGVDLHKHGNGEDAYLRDVINVGSSESITSTSPSPAPQTTPVPTPAPAPETTKPSDAGGTMAAGSKLTEGQRLTCPNKSHYLVMQSDGNLCIYTSSDRFVWCSMATKGSGCRLEMQTDGNLVVYDRNNQACWSSETHPHFDSKFSSSDWKPVRCALENDGTLCLYSASNKKVWSNKTGKLTGESNSGSGTFRLEYVSGAKQSYGGGGMPKAMVFKIKEDANGSYVTDLRSKGLSFEVTSDQGGKYDGEFSNLNDYCKNGDKACYGGYFYVPSNSGKPSYTLKVTVTLKKDGKTVDSYVVEQNIGG